MKSALCILHIRGEVDHHYVRASAKLRVFIGIKALPAGFVVAVVALLANWDHPTNFGIFKGVTRDPDVTPMLGSVGTAFVGAESSTINLISDTLPEVHPGTLVELGRRLRPTAAIYIPRIFVLRQNTDGEPSVAICCLQHCQGTLISN